ncbi:hypothetical protein [Thiolapillus sp.]
MISDKRLIPACLLAAFSTMHTVSADQWSRELEIYMLGANISGDSSMGRVEGADIDIDFGTILDTLQMGFMARFEAVHDSGWGLWLDYGFMDLSDKKKNDRGGVVSAKLRQGVLEAYGLYRQQITRGHIDYYAGLRWWDNDIDARVNPAILPGSLERGISEDWIDPVIGLRWTHEINGQWSTMLRGDVGGFGIGADITWAAAVAARYHFNDAFFLDMQYKATWVDYSNDDKGSPGYFTYDTVTHGPLLGLTYKF